MIKTYKGRTFVGLPGLRRVRKARGLTQQQLAEQAGVSNPTVIRIEKGELTTLDTLGKLAHVLGVDPEDLRSEEAPERSVSRLEAGEDGAGEIEDEYVTRYRMGGEHADVLYEDTIADAYLRIFRDEGGTPEVFKLAIKRAFSLGKDRGKALAEREVEEAT